jgi:hypothetical protein
MSKWFWNRVIKRHAAGARAPVQYSVLAARAPDGIGPMEICLRDGSKFLQ